MKTIVCKNAVESGRMASAQAAEIIKASIQENGKACIIIATGASQFELLQNLTKEKNIDWSKVSMFHLDEYIDLPVSHPASFRNYIRQRFLSQLPELENCYLIDGENKNPDEECDRLGKIISGISIDLALVGIGENGHLAFNDPPADFETNEPFIVVHLDDACRRQQLGEGWFKSLDEVPQKAISMSINQIMKSRNIICSVPDKRKALAVKNCLEGVVSNHHPASVLQNHTHCTVYLDNESASLLSNRNHEQEIKF